MEQLPGLGGRRHAYVLVRGVVWTSAMFLAACSSSEELASPRTDVTATSRNALTPAIVDVDTPEANVVVWVGHATGTLIAPQIVLTANHVIYGATLDETCVGHVVPTISIGRDGPFATGAVTVEVAHIESMPNGCTDSAVNDLALLYLREPVTKSMFGPTANAGISVPKVVRPRLLAPSEPGFYVPGASFGAAGNGGLSTTARRGFVLSNASFNYNSLSGWPTWKNDSDNWDTENGDSGGPLFYQHPDGHREVLGALFGHVDDSKTWPAITGGLNRQWLLDHVKESNVPDVVSSYGRGTTLRHTPGWLSRHGRTSDSWWGELDYSGPCQPAVDRDCDGWWDQGGMPVHDNCAFIANPDQMDTNDDGRGDLCQLCPYDPNNDEDGDGICATLSPYAVLQKPDNCPRVKNNGLAGTMGQENCNEEAELVKRRANPDIEVLGDACDPVPCPRTRALASGEVRHGIGGGHPQFGGFYSGRVIMDDIESTRVSPHVKAPPGGVPIARNLAETETFARFCQQNAELFYDCHADPNIRDSALLEFPSASAETARQDRPWHRVLLGANGLDREAGWTWNYDNTTAPTHKWMYALDWGFWQTGGRIPPADSSYLGVCGDSQSVGNGTCLDGALWYHATTDVGNTNAYVNGQLVGLHGEDLANHYFDIKPDRAYAKTYAGTGLMRKLFFLIHTLADPAPYETVLRPRVRPLVAEAELGTPHVLEDHGGSYDATAMISYVTASTLAYPGVVWAGAVEHAKLSANLDDRIQAMALSADGTTVLDTTLLDHGMLMSGYELGYPYSSEGARGAPGARTGFLALLSRQAGGVFVIGGRDAETNEELADIHLWRPGVGWSTIVPSLNFRSAKSATVSPSDGKLWILDDRSGRYTLLRVSPWTGEAERLGAWDTTGAWDQHFLAVDRDGQVLLLASSRNDQRTKIGRVRVGTAGAYASQIDAESIPYTTSAPIVDSDEYGVIVRDDTGAVTSVFRRANLLGAAGTYSLSSFF